MRSETEVRENLEWLQAQCIHYQDNEADQVVRQLEVLMWVLGRTREEAEKTAIAIWQDSRSARTDHPRNY